MIRTGRVSENSTKQHLAISGRAYCGAGNGRIIGDTKTLGTKTDLCGRCAHRVRRMLDDRLSTAAVSVNEKNQIAEIRHAHRSTAEVAEDSQLANAIADTVAVVWAEPEEPTWAQRQARVAALLAP